MATVEHGRRGRVPALAVVAVAVAALAAAGACRSPGGVAQSARAVDEWTRSYQLAPGGAVEITNTTGTVDVEAADGNEVNVRAERIAQATTDRGARDLLTHITIGEDIKPDAVAISTERIQGVLIGVSFQVNYHVRMPAAATVRIRTADGQVRISGISGRITIINANGNVVGEAVSGTVTARTVNGDVNIDMPTFAAEFIDLRTVNGRVQLAVPPDVNANLSATATNGRVEITGLEFESFGDPVRDTRRVRGRINKGGAPIELNAVRGGIHVLGHE